MNFTNRQSQHPGRVQAVKVQGQDDVYDVTLMDGAQEQGTPLNAQTFAELQESILNQATAASVEAVKNKVLSSLTTAALWPRISEAIEANLSKEIGRIISQNLVGPALFDSLKTANPQMLNVNEYTLGDHSIKCNVPVILYIWDYSTVLCKAVAANANWLESGFEVKKDYNVIALPICGSITKTTVSIGKAEQSVTTSRAQMVEFTFNMRETGFDESDPDAEDGDDDHEGTHVVHAVIKVHTIG